MPDFTTAAKNPNIQPGFFFTFAHDTRFQRLIWPAFAAWKFREAGEPSMVGAPADQKTVSTAHQRNRDNNLRPLLAALGHLAFSKMFC